MKYYFNDSNQDELDKDNGQFYSDDNPYNGGDDKDGADLYDSYMDGFYYIEDDNEDNIEN